MRYAIRLNFLLPLCCLHFLVTALFCLYYFIFFATALFFFLATLLFLPLCFSVAILYFSCRFSFLLLLYFLFAAALSFCLHFIFLVSPKQQKILSGDNKIIKQWQKLWSSQVQPAQASLGALVLTLQSNIMVKVKKEQNLKKQFENKNQPRYWHLITSDLNVPNKNVPHNSRFL